mgnify:CR=1 FL=1
MKVLVIDEDKFVINIYESEFHQQNIEVVAAFDGADGWEKVKAEKPDLIIMELILFKINGFDLIKKIKNDKKLKNIPIVVCSSLNQQDDIDESMKLGALKYFSKQTYSLKQVTKEVLDILISLM